MTEDSILETIISALEEGDNKRALDIAKKRLYSNEGLLVLDSSHKRTVQESFKTLVISATASATGAAFVYPIDLVKTRMQNQRNAIGIEGILYKNSLDCLKKVIQTEGLLSLYRGLGVNLMGQVPEKTIRLFVIDRIRNACMQYYGKSLYQGSKSVKYLTEATAGCCVGALQVIITNPAEIIKVRLQLTSSVSNSTTSSIFRDIGGIKGMYRGASACFLRDIPFSGIYFPTYAICKDMLNIQNNDLLGFFNVLLSGSIAGMAAAAITTPADVIKTRLQAKNSSEYRGLFDCLHKIISTEGYKALFKGLLPRVIRSSPQYGCMLLSYEILLKLLKEEEKVTPQLFDQQISYSSSNVRDKYFSLHKWTPPPHFYNNSLPTFKTVSIGGSGTIWAISEDNKPYLWNGFNWHLVPNTNLSTISCGGDGTACGIDNINNTIQIWSPWHMKFFTTPNTYNLSKVSVGNADKIWALDNKGQVYCYEKDNAWTIKGNIIMNHISVGADGTVFAVDIHGHPFKWVDANWQKVHCDKLLHKISVGSNSSVWGVDTENNLYRYLENRWIAQDYKTTHISAAHDGTVLGLIERMKNNQK